MCSPHSHSTLHNHTYNKSSRDSSRDSPCSNVDLLHNLHMTTVARNIPATSRCVLPSGPLSSEYSSETVVGCFASFSLLSATLRTRARALDKVGAGRAALGWASNSVLPKVGAVRLLWTCRMKAN